MSAALTVRVKAEIPILIMHVYSTSLGKITSKGILEPTATGKLLASSQDVVFTYKPRPDAGPVRWKCCESKPVALEVLNEADNSLNTTTALVHKVPKPSHRQWIGRG